MKKVFMNGKYMGGSELKAIDSGKVTVVDYIKIEFQSDYCRTIFDRNTKQIALYDIQS